MGNRTEIVIDESGDKKYFTQIPNIVDELGLSPLEECLYFFYKRHSYKGGGAVEIGVRDLMNRFGCGAKAIRKAKGKLVELGLIDVESFPKADSRPDRVTVLDIWERNFEFFKSKPVLSELHPVTTQAHPVFSESQPLCSVSNSPVFSESQFKDKDIFKDGKKDEESLSPRANAKKSKNSSEIADEIFGVPGRTKIETEEAALIEGLKTRLKTPVHLPDAHEWLEVGLQCRENEYDTAHFLKIYDLLEDIRVINKAGWFITAAMVGRNIGRKNALETEIANLKKPKKGGRQNGNNGEEERLEQHIADSNKRFRRAEFD